ncbi:maternal protein tudor-like isoform X2 [Cydia strobilella]|uniref:maternal protein tudor-like isoform X2 n=1 Tax=Cydia strobilella TaxID=1100964 RepID=UPI00300455FD
MALPAESQRSFRLYVTHVDGEGPFLKISGQLDQQSSLMVESLFESARGNLEKGIGAVTAAAIHEGIICAAKYKDGTYYRAKIIDISNLSTGLLRVHFIDYGNKDRISLSAIRFLDQYDPMFLQLPGQATDYYLSRIMHPAGRWDEALLLKLQSLLCYAEYPAAVEGQTCTLPIISIQYKGNDFSTHLVSNRFGNAMPVTKQEVLMLPPMGTDRQQGPNWAPNFIADSTPYAEHIPFLMNQNLPSNPASAMRLQQNASVPFNGAIVPPPSAISQRLLVNKASRGPVNLKGPIRQPQVALNSPPVQKSTPPPAAALNKSLSPKKSATYKSRLLEVNSQHKVFVSFAEEGPELFAVQLVTDAKKLQDMMDDINKSPLSSLVEPPMIGTVCVGRMSGDRIICRAIVMNLSGSQCKLFFVDFGDTEMVSYYDIFDIPEEFVKPNVFAMRFCLSGVKKLQKGPYLNEAFKQLVNGKVMTLRVVAPEGPPLIQYGELYLDNKNVLDLLLANIKDKLQFRWMEMLALGSRASVLVSYVDSCIKFYIQLSDKIDDLTAVMEAVKVHCEGTSSPGELPIGTACCARFPDDEKWYRAKVLGSNNKRVLVAYVDYGNEQEVNVSDLRTITADLLKLPAQAMKCALKGFENKPVESKTSNQLEMLALEKTLTANVVGVLSSDTILVSLVDDTTSPPLDVARKMNQLSQPRSNVETKPTTPVSKAAPEQFSSPESDHGKGFKREKSFREDRRPRDDDDFGQRGGSFRNRDREPFDRSGPGRHSDKFGGRPDKGERRGKPWENSAPPAPAGDEWEESVAAAPAPAPSAAPAPRPHFRDRDNRDNRDRDNSDNKFKQDEWEEKKDDWGSGTQNRNDRFGQNRGERREWGEKKDWSQKREFRDRGENNRGDRDRTRSNFTPRDRAERADRSFGSDSDKRSERSFGRAGNKPRSKFTQVQYKELPDPVPLESRFDDPTIESETQHEVSVTWIISPKSFYAQLISFQPKFLEMMHKIPELYKGVRSYSGIVPVGASVLARYPVDGVLYRATVVSAQPFSKFIVQYIDFGNKQLVDAKDIWQLDRQLLELPKMAIHCSLIGVAPIEGEWKADPEIDLCFNAPRYQCVFQECVEGQYQVSLWNNGASVTDMLVEKQLAVLSEQQSSVALKDEAIDLTIIVGQQIPCRVTHFESYEKFYVQLDLEKAELVENAIANFDVNLLTPLTQDTLTDGIHCTVKHEGKIYRAILNDTSDANNVVAVLPDYGNTVTTSLANLMILPTELSVYYYQSLECCLNNYTAECNILMPLEELKTALTGNKFIVYVDSVEGIRLKTTLYDISTGKKLAILEPDEGAFEDVVTLCARTVFNYNFGLCSVQHLQNLNEIYLQKTADIDKVQQLLDKLYVFYDEGTPEQLEEFEPDTLCAAKSSDGNWYRATIVSAADSDVTVQFPDYGNTETVAKDTVNKLDKSFYEPCAQALVASLGLVAVTDDAVTKLSEWTTDKEVQVTLAFGTDGWLASLHLDGVDLSMKLVNEKLATPQVSSEEEPAPAPAPAHEPAPAAETVEPVSLPPGCTQVYISHIDSPGHFWLQMADKVDKIDEIQAELAAAADTYEDLQAREVGTLCVAKYSADDLWYRAEVLDLDSDITTVRFVDYGNTDVLDNSPGLIKTMPESLRAVEPLCVRSGVNAVPTGTGEWSEAAGESFEALVGDTAQPVDALIVLKDVTTYVDLYVAGRSLTDRLVAQGHAARAEQPTECGDLPSCFASHVNSPSEFWVQLESATTELQAMEAAMEDAESLPELAAREEGVLCAARYPEDGAWYRAQVIVDGSEGTEVLFMDYGNASIATELRTLPDELKLKPALSRKCALQKPRDVKSWSRKSEIKFNELAAEGRTIFNVQFIASGDISIVELYLEGKSVTEELVGLCEERPPAERPKPVGQDLHSKGKLCYVHALDEFYVHLDDKTADLDKVTERMVDVDEFESAAALKVGSICAAYWAEDEQWYRGKILEFCDASYHVQFLDYGNKAKCLEFRRLPLDVAAIEPLAKCCRLAAPAGADDDAARNKLDELMANDSTFHIEFLDSTSEPALVKLILNGEDVSTILFASRPSDTEKAETVPETAAPENIQVPEEETASTAAAAETDVQPEETVETGSEDVNSETEKIDKESTQSVVETSEVEEPVKTREEVDLPESVVKPSEVEKPVEKREEVDLPELVVKPSEVEKPVETREEVDLPELVVEPSEVEKPVETREEVDLPESVLKPSEEEKPVETREKVDSPKTGEKEVPKSVLIGDNEKQTEDYTEKETEDEDKFEDANELDSSHPDLDESLESNHTVIENKSFEANPDSLNDSGDHKAEQRDSPKQDTSSSTLESSSGTIKTPERDNSKDSINTDTGYTSSNGTKDGSPIKEFSNEPTKLESDVGETISEVKTQKLVSDEVGKTIAERENKLKENNTEPSVKSSEVSKVKEIKTIDVD